jgi:hypothetical protein
LFLSLQNKLWCLMILIIPPAAKFALLSSFFVPKHECYGNPSWIMLGLRPKCN